MPRRKTAEAPLPQSDGSGESKETFSKLSPAEENGPNTSEVGKTTSTEAAEDPTVERQVTSFTPVNEISSKSLPPPSTRAHRPVERLASLNIGNRTASRQSSLTQQAGTPEHSKRLKVQPKSAVRRSKEEREATEKAEAERLQARLAASVTSSSLNASRGGTHSRGTARGGLGGTSRQWQSERYATSGAAGFLGGATPAEDKRKREVASKSRGGGRGTMLTGLSRETDDVKSSPRVKKETGAKKGKMKDKDGDIVMGGNVSDKVKSAKVKKEQGTSAHESSDDDFFDLEDEGKRIDIERINLVSEDEVSDEPSKGKGKAREWIPKPPGISFMRPIRIDRHDHEERTVSVNTEASSLTSAELRKRAKARGQAQGSLFLPETLGPIEDRPTRGEGNARGRDVEFVRDERKWQGVYQDEDDNSNYQVKQEPKDDDNDVELDDPSLSSQTVTLDMLRHDDTSRLEEDAAPVRPQPLTKSPSTGPQPKRRSKAPGGKAMRRRKPVLQTEEDHQEWQRYKRDILLLADHLRMPDHDNQSRDLEVDSDGDAKLTDVDGATIRDRKHNTVFLFQLPPTLPNIEDPQKLQQGKIRRKPVDLVSDTEVHKSSTSVMKDASKTKQNPETKSKPIASSSSTDVKAIKSESSNTALPFPSTFRTQSTHALPSQPTNPLPPGRLGAIKLDSTGFPSATWTPRFRLDLGCASDYGALQEVVLLKSETIELPPKKVVKGVVKQEERVIKEEGLGVSEKKAWAVGQMGGGFVLGPDWGWMFGDR
ncbi:MAG: hypothetical protein L6R36_002118 [Xanthoria steineri]|nr:MAG: hypothetical protein L6R36_002118 [Xanthoria steineri]